MKRLKFGNDLLPVINKTIDIVVLNDLGNDKYGFTLFFTDMTYLKVLPTNDGNLGIEVV